MWRLYQSIGDASITEGFGQRLGRFSQEDCISLSQEDHYGSHSSVEEILLMCKKEF